MFKLVVLSSVLALAASSAIAPWGLGLGAHGWAGPGWAGAGWAGHGLGVAAPWGAWGGLAAPLAAAHVAAPVAVGPAVGANYRGPLSLAPGQPANILAADGRPLDTLSVNLDRAAHLTARVVDGAHGHLLHKRSAPLLAPAAWSHTARVDIPAARLVAPVGLGPAAVAPWGLGAGHLGAHWGAAPLAHGVWGRGW